MSRPQSVNIRLMKLLRFNLFIYKKGHFIRLDLVFIHSSQALQFCKAVLPIYTPIHHTRGFRPPPSLLAFGMVTPFGFSQFSGHLLRNVSVTYSHSHPLQWLDSWPVALGWPLICRQLCTGRRGGQLTTWWGWSERHNKCAKL